MQIGTKVKILSSPYSIFEAGSENTVCKIVKEHENDSVGILYYLLDPFYSNTDIEDALWPFLEDELEVVQ